jgi:hypothetical protein
VYAENTRRELPGLVEKLGIKGIFDAPCGDYNWFRLIKWASAITYIGGDLVPRLVEQNQNIYGGPSTSFVKVNVVNDKLPNADLWLCRACLFHLSNNDVLLTIGNFLRSDIRYLLTSTHSACGKDVDIPTGAFRMLNLQRPPFCLGGPLAMIEDWIEGFQSDTLPCGIESH